jgi:hypothetical protein
LERPAADARHRELRNRIEAVFALPLDSLLHDNAKLKAALDRIGTEVR